MSTIENNVKGKNKYLSFVKKISFMGKHLLIKIHIGKMTVNVSKENYLLENIDEISNKEFELRKKFLGPVNNKLSNNEKLPEIVEAKAIRINNLMEAKGYPKTISTDFSIKFIYNSNNIEGSKLPEEEVRKIVKTSKTNYHNKNEAKEAFNSIICKYF